MPVLSEFRQTFSLDAASDGVEHPLITRVDAIASAAVMRYRSSIARAESGIAR